MAAQCFVFFVAGFETSATTMSLCLYELALNRDIQDKLRLEVDTVLEQHNGDLTDQSVQEMKYLDRVVDGTKTIIEEGVNVKVPVYALHYDAKYYPDPEKFDPDRFTEENKNKRPHYTYLPFGEGPRMCIGMRFGLLQTKVGVSTLLSRFRFTPCAKTPKTLCFQESMPVTTAKGELWLQVTDRMKN